MLWLTCCCITYVTNSSHNPTNFLLLKDNEDIFFSFGSSFFDYWPKMYIQNFYPDHNWNKRIKEFNKSQIVLLSSQNPQVPVEVWIKKVHKTVTVNNPIKMSILQLYWKMLSSIKIQGSNGSFLAVVEVQCLQVK